MRLLHFRRTFVEKLFAIHGKVELLKREGRPVGTYARHYYDLFELARQSEVRRCSARMNTRPSSPITTRSAGRIFEHSYFAPRDMSFASSDALFPPPELARVLGPEYENAMPTALFRSVPVLERSAGAV